MDIFADYGGTTCPTHIPGRGLTLTLGAGFAVAGLVFTIVAANSPAHIARRMARLSFESGGIRARFWRTFHGSSSRMTGVPVRPAHANRARVAACLPDLQGMSRRTRTRTRRSRSPCFNVFDQSFPVGMLDPSSARRGSRATGQDRGRRYALYRASVSFRGGRATAALNEVELRPTKSTHLEAAIQGRAGRSPTPHRRREDEHRRRLMLSLPCRWLFLVDSADLVEAGAERYQEITGRDCGHDRGRKFTTGDIVFATFRACTQTRKTPMRAPTCKACGAFSLTSAFTPSQRRPSADVLDHLPNALPTAPGSARRRCLAPRPQEHPDDRTARLGGLQMTPGELSQLPGTSPSPRDSPRSAPSRCLGAALQRLPRTLRREVEAPQCCGPEGVTLMAKQGSSSSRRKSTCSPSSSACRAELRWCVGEKSTTQREAATGYFSERRNLQPQNTKGADIPFLMGGPTQAAEGGHVAAHRSRAAPVGRRCSTGSDIATRGKAACRPHCRPRGDVQARRPRDKARASLKAQAIPDFDAKQRAPHERLSGQVVVGRTRRLWRPCSCSRSPRRWNLDVMSVPRARRHVRASPDPVELWAASYRERRRHQPACACSSVRPSRRP